MTRRDRSASDARQCDHLFEALPFRLERARCGRIGVALGGCDFAPFARRLGELVSLADHSPDAGRLRVVAVPEDGNDLDFAGETSPKECHADILAGELSHVANFETLKEGETERRLMMSLAGPIFRLRLAPSHAEKPRD